MKKTITLCLLAVSAFSVKAQLDPLTSWLYNELWFNVAAHDSIIFDEDDSTGNYTPDVTQWVNYHADGTTDTAAIYYAGDNYPSLFYSSVVNGNVTTVYEVDTFGGTSDTIYYTNFYANASGKDTLVESFYFDGTDFVSDTYFSASYDANNLLTHAYILADTGSGPVEIANIVTYISNNRIDSASQNVSVWGISLEVSRYVNTFVGLNHTEFSIYETDDPLVGNFYLYDRYTFSHNLIGEITEYYNDYNMYGDGVMHFYERAKFLQTGNSSAVSEEKVAQLEVYPNPTSSYVNFNTTQQVDYTVINTTGAVLMAGKTNGRLDISALPNGVYLLKISNGSDQRQARIIKN